MARKNQVRLDSTIYCKAQKVELSVEKCLDLFVEANAFAQKESCCFRCPQGQRVRNTVARS